MLTLLLVLGYFHVLDPSVTMRLNYNAYIENYILDNMLPNCDNLEKTMCTKPGPCRQWFSRFAVEEVDWPT